MHVMLKLGTSSFSSLGFRGENVIFALVDPVTYLGCKLGQGHQGQLSPQVGSPGAKFGWLGPKGIVAVRQNVRTHARTHHPPTHLRTVITTISPWRGLSARRGITTVLT